VSEPAGEAEEQRGQKQASGAVRHSFQFRWNEGGGR
jgi:hypothetical protein